MDYLGYLERIESKQVIALRSHQKHGRETHNCSQGGSPSRSPFYCSCFPSWGAVVAEPGQLTIYNGDALVALTASPSSSDERIPGLFFTPTLLYPLFY